LTSSAASVASPSDLSEPECGPSPSVKSIHSAGMYSDTTGLPSRSLKTSAPSIQVDWVGSMSSAVDSRAKTSALLEPLKRRASRAHDPGCGSKCSGSCVSADPVGCLLRMSLASELSALTGYSATWLRRTTPGGRSWWVLATSELRTRALESGSLPTPTASAYGSNQGGAAGRVGPRRYSLRKMMLTPTETANLLCPSMQKWPGARAFTKLVSHFGSGKPALFRATRWLMGYPTTWMQGLRRTETPSSLSSQSLSAES